MHETPYPDLLILLAAAVLVVALFRSFRLSPVLGYLVAGALIGPHGFGLIHEVKTTAAIAEFGIALLLFMIGLELSWDRLVSMRRNVFGVGGAQVILTTAIISAVMLTLGFGGSAALIVGAGLALSSTALVLQVLHERKEIASQTGRLSLAILILQDLAVLPLLALVPMLSVRDVALAPALLQATLQGVLVLALIFLLGRALLRPLFRFIARLDINELFVATTLLVVMSLAYATHAAGLSMALGAFIAGLLLAETEFQHQIEADVKPYKGLLMGLFFMTIGMAMNTGFILENSLLVLASALAFITLKGAIIYGILRTFAYAQRTAMHTALLLAGGGEFGFILFGLAAAGGLLGSELSQFLLLVISVSMALTPLLERFGSVFERHQRLRRRDDLGALKSEAVDLEDHIVIAGYGRVGEKLAEALSREALSFMAVDIDPRRVLAGKRQHHPVYFGDATRPDVLEAVGASRASLMVLSFGDEQKTQEAITKLRAAYPNMAIFARARDASTKARLEALGATATTAERDSATMTLLAFTLTARAWPEEEITRVMLGLKG